MWGRPQTIFLGCTSHRRGAILELKIKYSIARNTNLASLVLSKGNLHLTHIERDRSRRIYHQFFRPLFPSSGIVLSWDKGGF